MPRILIVDDEPQYGEYLGEWLSRQGHEVKTVTTSHDAIGCSAAWRPHVLVADWMLKDRLDGLQVSAAVRNANPALQTILITGYPSAELKALAEQAQVFRFVEKPFTLHDITGAVNLAADEAQRLYTRHVLIVSDASVVRQATAEMLESAGLTCHAAESSELACQTLEREEKIAVAILDCIEPTPATGVLAESLRSIRPGLTLVGCSENADDRRRFADLGVKDFLPRYWEVGEFLKLLAVPISHCIVCGLPLPLVRAPLREDAPSLECGMCGARYRAMIRDDAPEDVRRNVRRVV